MRMHQTVAATRKRGWRSAAHSSSMWSWPMASFRKSSWLKVLLPKEWSPRMSAWPSYADLKGSVLAQRASTWPTGARPPILKAPTGDFDAPSDRLNRDDEQTANNRKVGLPDILGLFARWPVQIP
jgi:hypothetical protein